jgi:hypothetical protein
MTGAFASERGRARRIRTLKLNYSVPSIRPRASHTSRAKGVIQQNRRRFPLNILTKRLLDGASRQDDPASLGQLAPVPVVDLGALAVDLCGSVCARKSCRRQQGDGSVKRDAMATHRRRSCIPRKRLQRGTESRHTVDSGTALPFRRAYCCRWLRGTTRRQRRESRSGHWMPVRK